MTGLETKHYTEINVLHTDILVMKVIILMQLVTLP